MGVDGVAVVAKMQQQRSRRFMSSLSKSKFDSNAFTPGTQYMVDMDSHIRRWLQEQQINALIPKKTIYSPWNKEGEGEQKVVGLLRDGTIISKDTDAAHVVHGNDADIIMLCSLLPTYHVYWMRQEKDKNPDYINIDNFKEYLYENMGNHLHNIDDFVVMMFILGNDFIPHTPSLDDIPNSIDLLFAIYQEKQLRLTNDDKTINWENYLNFLSSLEELEPETMEKMIDHKYHHGFKALEYATKESTVISGGTKHIDKKFDYEIFRKGWYYYSLGPQDEIGTDIYAKLMGNKFNVTDEDLDLMVIQYAEGISWTYNYYTGGVYGAKLDWFYNYRKAPLFVVIVSRRDLILEHYNLGHSLKYHEDEYYLNPLHQLLSLLPRSSVSLLPKEATPLISIWSPIGDYYPDKFIVDDDGITKEFLSKPIIPFIDPERIVDAVRKHVKHTNKLIDMFTPADDTIIERTTSDETLREMTSQLRRLNYQSRGRGDYKSRGSGGYQPRGRGDYQSRGRGDYQSRGRGRGDYQSRGRGRGDYQSRGRGRGENRHGNLMNIRG